MKFVRVAVVLLILTAIAIFIFLQNSKNVPPEVQKYIKKEDIPKIYPYPVRVQNFTDVAPITSKAAVVLDVKTGVTLFEKNASIRQLPASTTKLMTALVALEKCTPDQIITVQAYHPEPTQMGLTTGDTLTMQSLLYGLLINSGNDAASVLSYSCASSAENFVLQMNQKALEIEMKNTHFANPEGFDDPMQYSTAKDLAKLARVAVANPLISKIVATKSTVVTDTSGTKTYYLENINKLLGSVDGVEGIKTGQTTLAQEILITKTTRDGNTVLIVILGSLDRFTESKNLIEWTFANHTWIKP
ncbi:MAG: D-alanyl-D-alanine carboxypeptidase family protein [Candidatus Curtissbacteria bacterium]|nr:D-alanyl-D-alanine carboxypeptidase family protein [Candidatus Curtissbacteria bacterium]